MAGFHPVFTSRSSPAGLPGHSCLPRCPCQGVPANAPLGGFVLSPSSETRHAWFHGPHVHAALPCLLAPSPALPLDRPGDPSPADLSLVPAEQRHGAKTPGFSYTHFRGCGGTAGAGSTEQLRFGSREGVKSSRRAKWPWAWRLQEAKWNLSLYCSLSRPPRSSLGKPPRTARGAPADLAQRPDPLRHLAPVVDLTTCREGAHLPASLPGLCS